MQVLDADYVRQTYAAWLKERVAARPWAPADLGDWERQRGLIRRHVLDSLALWPLPERPPLAVRYGGTLARDGYTLRRVYFQTWPGVYASGWLYMPTGVAGPLPAILHPHGHFENGNRHPTVQARLIALAKMGYIGLTVDSEHLYDWAAGVTPMTVMTWNNIRGIDLLCSLPEVDRTRIGCTGCSGGGQQTAFLMAVEDRIAAAVAVGYVCCFDELLFPEWTHCPCNHVPGLLTLADIPQMSAVFAPRPALYISMTGDWTHAFLERNLPDLQRVWTLFGAADRVSATYHDSPHDYSKPMREEAYGFFDRWFRGGSGDPIPEPAIEAETLDTLASLDDPPASAGLAGIRAEVLRRRTSSPTDALCFRARLADLLGGAGPIEAAPVSRVVRSGVLLRMQARALTLESDGALIPAVLLSPLAPGDIATEVAPASHPSAGGRAMVVLDPMGKQHCLDERTAWVESQVGDGTSVLLVDPRYYGEWALSPDVVDLNGAVLGQPPAGCAVRDALAAVALLRNGSPVSFGSVAIAGFGDGAVVAMLAGLVDPSVASVEAYEVGPSYADGRDRPRVPHILTLTDVPDMVRRLGERCHTR